MYNHTGLGRIFHSIMLMILYVSPLSGHMKLILMLSCSTTIMATLPWIMDGTVVEVTLFTIWSRIWSKEVAQFTELASNFMWTSTIHHMLQPLELILKDTTTSASRFIWPRLMSNVKWQTISVKGGATKTWRSKVKSTANSLKCASRRQIVRASRLGASLTNSPVSRSPWIHYHSIKISKRRKPIGSWETSWEILIEMTQLSSREIRE